jgi:hypothetical protein
MTSDDARLMLRAGHGLSCLLSNVLVHPGAVCLYMRDWDPPPWTLGVQPGYVDRAFYLAIWKPPGRAPRSLWIEVGTTKDEASDVLAWIEEVLP